MFTALSLRHPLTAQKMQVVDSDGINRSVGGFVFGVVTKSSVHLHDKHNHLDLEKDNQEKHIHWKGITFYFWLQVPELTHSTHKTPQLFTVVMS